MIIEYRWALSRYDRLGALASELVRRPVNLIVAVGAEPSARAAKAATATIYPLSQFSVRIRSPPGSSQASADQEAI